MQNNKTSTYLGVNGKKGEEEEKHTFCAPVVKFINTIMLSGLIGMIFWNDLFIPYGMMSIFLAQETVSVHVFFFSKPHFQRLFFKFLVCTDQYDTPSIFFKHLFLANIVFFPKQRHWINYMHFSMPFNRGSELGLLFQPSVFHCRLSCVFVVHFFCVCDVSMYFPHTVVIGYE